MQLPPVGRVGSERTSSSSSKSARAYMWAILTKRGEEITGYSQLLIDVRDDSQLSCSASL